VPGWLITVHSDFIRTKLQNSKYADSSAVLLLPSLYTKPSAVVVAPALIGGCDPLIMDATASFGGGGRDLEYRCAILNHEP